MPPLHIRFHNIKSKEQLSLMIDDRTIKMQYCLIDFINPVMMTHFERMIKIILISRIDLTFFTFVHKRTHTHTTHTHQKNE